MARNTFLELWRMLLPANFRLEVSSVSRSIWLEVSHEKQLLVSPVNPVSQSIWLEVSLVNPLVNPVSQVNPPKKVRG